VEYHEITILPSDKYTKLLKMIMDVSSDFKVVMLLATSGIKSHEAAELAELVVQISIVCDLAPELINCLIMHDIKIADCQETLFRGNSVGSKALDYYMKCIGSRWLKTLNTPISLISMSDKICEVRQSKLKPDENWKENQINLVELFNATSAIIFNTAYKCPLPLRKIFRHIRAEVRKVFPDPSVEYTAVTGFLFLRFFVPAIMTPKLFGLADDYCTGNTERTFTLVATLLQKIANLQTFEPHEAHFDALNDILIAEHVNLKKFIDELCTTEKLDEEAEAANTLREDIDLDLILARLCHYLSSHQAALEGALQDKYIVTFLSELEIVFDEMKFLWKNYKNQQSKRRETQLQMALTQSAPPTPTIAREKVRTHIHISHKDAVVKRRHSFSLDRLSLVKNTSKVSRIRSENVVGSSGNSELDESGEENNN